MNAETTHITPKVICDSGETEMESTKNKILLFKF